MYLLNPTTGGCCGKGRRDLFYSTFNAISFLVYLHIATLCTSKKALQINLLQAQYMNMITYINFEHLNNKPLTC